MLIHETHLYCRLYNSILKLLYRRMHNAFPRVWNFPYFDMFEDLLLHRYLEILQISGGGKGSVAVLMVHANVYHIICTPVYIYCVSLQDTPTVSPFTGPYTV